jgi:acetyl-CoA decarbonylase/synthase complex subunit delta
LAFAISTVKYSGAINEVVLGSANKLTVGGETSYPFFTFEGKMPNKPKIAMEIWDMDPGEDWPEAARAPFAGVLGDPAAWAKKCVEYGADLVVVQLKSTDPNSLDKGPADAVATVKAVLEAVDVPVAVYGVANKEKDIATLSAVAETFQGRNLILGPVEEHNHKQIGAQALAYGHTIAANTPIDVNLAKQLNILLGNLGVSNKKIIIDPTTGGLGYGMEYCYSVMERLRMAALVQQDENLQQPIINNMGQEVWKCKEAKESLEDAPTLGYGDERGVLMEVTQAVSMLLAGSDILFLRHPDSVKLVKAYIDLLLEGGVAAGSYKEVRTVPMDKLPKVDFKPAGPPKKEVKAAPAKKAAPQAEAKPAPKAEAKPGPTAEAKPAPKAEAAPAAKEAAPPAVDEAAQAAAKAKAEADAKAKAEADAKAKAAADAKAKADADAKAKADAEAKAKAEVEAKAKAKAAEEEKLQALRLQRAQEMEALMAKRAAEAGAKADRQPVKADWRVAQGFETAMNVVASLNRVHKRDQVDVKVMFPAASEMESK